VEKVQIGDLAGEYFKGSFVYEDGQSVATWDPNFGIETLRWVDGDTSYRMQYVSFQTLLGKEGMAALAESMTLESIVKPPMPAPDATAESWNPRDDFPLSIPEAEQQAGFKLMLPEKLPEILSFSGASYDAKLGYVQVFYLGPMTDGLTVNQQIALDPADCVLCDILTGDYYDVQEGDPDYILLVPPDANIETVQIGAVAGKYVEGVWHGTDCCGWVWEPDPYLKTLRWWKDGIAFELQYFGLDIEKADMIRIAESLK
jgi:hypothetical protein